MMQQGRGKMDTCKHLVENLGFDVDVRANDGSGKTPLACAVSCGKVIAVRYLLHKGADLNKQDVRGFTPLHYTAKQGYDGIARLLLSRGANVDLNSSKGAPLHVAAAHGNSGVMQILLEHHADPDRVSPDLCTPLADVLWAAREQVSESDCLKCMKLLVKAGADLNSADPDTPLVIATSKGLPGSFTGNSYFHGFNLLHATDEMGDNLKRDTMTCGNCDSLLTITLTQGHESDEDSNIQQNLHHESAVRDDTGASRACTEDKLSDEDRKAQLQMHGGKAVARMDYAGATKFYTEAYHRALWAPSAGRRAAAAERSAELRAKVLAARPRACMAWSRRHASGCAPAETCAARREFQETASGRGISSNTRRAVARPEPKPEYAVRSWFPGVGKEMPDLRRAAWDLAAARISVGMYLLHKDGIIPVKIDDIIK
ncbi:tankyrase-like [Panicum miliaceum]|uniref:Tankyrase-like n=1 Tax=Panicum miliaceum TaxID=4540 RepID=A0A3L6PC76_PANMI|nr:tankyrase-like [Panicum miliaceum]